MDCEHNSLVRPEHCHDANEYMCDTCEAYVTLLKVNIEKVTDYT